MDRLGAGRYSDLADGRREGARGGDLVSTMHVCVCPKVKDMGPISASMNEMNEKMSFKMGVKFAVPVYLVRIF